MSLIAQQIELATGVPISYEEAPIENSSDLEDGTLMMDANYRKAHPLEKLFLPVTTHVQAEIHVDRGPTPRARAIAALSEVQALPAFKNYAMRFNVVQMGSQLVITATQRRGLTGAFVPAKSPLDQLISFDSGDNLSLYNVLTNILAAASKTTGVEIGLGDVPTNQVVRLHTTAKAQNVTIRSLIHMALDNAAYSPGQRGSAFTWRLIYIAQTRSYLLHIMVAAKSVPAPFGGTINIPIMPREAAQGGQMSEPIGTNAP